MCPDVRAEACLVAGDSSKGLRAPPSGLAKNQGAGRAAGCFGEVSDERARGGTRGSRDRPTPVTTPASWPL